MLVLGTKNWLEKIPTDLKHWKVYKNFPQMGHSFFFCSVFFENFQSLP